MMLEIHFIVPPEVLARALKVADRPREWDVRTIEGHELLGVVEELGDGSFTFTDTFGRMTRLKDSFTSFEAFRDVETLFNQRTLN